ncbi:ribonucleoside-diphosphate reductase subunit alpha [Ornithinimicrobium sp. LYQ92]|uniref:ribonucleoside-diphosphate reductase subunit alpha n=1 Tax=Serinicoccus sp. LYQ92 TaxID=3378798 RepID=UPI003854D538
MVSTTVIKRDGSRADYDGAEIARSIESAARGLDDAVLRSTQLQSELEITLFDGITSEQLDQSVIQVALQNVKDDPAYDMIAARLLVKTMYKAVFGDTRDLLGEDDPEVIRAKHRQYFPGFVHRGVRSGLLDPRLAELFDLDALATALDPARDDLLRYIGAQTLRTRYALNDADPARTVLETPQFFWMRVAMGLSLTEADPTAAALAFYDAMSRLEYLAAGSTLVNAGTAYSQLSNCFVMQMEDDIEHIGKSVRDVMWLTKGTGGIGMSVSKLRSEGSPIRSNNTTSTGPIPFMHTIDSTLRAISRGGKKFGALCFYMENWHLDFAQFLDLRQNSGDPYRRTRTANTAVWISDEFMKRVQADDEWYLFDPLTTPDLVELTGAAFSARYAHYVTEARAGRLRHKKVRAREQWRAILISLQTTSHPWLTWKDSVNTRALNHNTGTIHSSNLCTEITLPQDRDNVSVCNLASINLSRHVHGRHSTGEVTIDWDRLAHSARLAVRQLDNLIDITISSVPESERSNELNRALGLGVMGFTDVVERFGLSYESSEAYDLIDSLVEFVSWHAIDASADLARERGAYPNFAGSRWSEGMVPVDSLDLLEADRGLTVEVDRRSEMDWDVLREKVAGGIRNSTLMAIAPTASIGLVAGTTPGLDPQFSQIFSRATSAGKFLEVNRNLVADLAERGLWEDLREDLLRHQGDLSKVEGAPADLQEIYRTSFQLSPYAFLHVAARAQKWIDQAISRNIYLASRDVGGMQELYSAAWRMGVKTTYYLHMMPRHTAEQSTVKVNKAAQPASSSTAASSGGSSVGSGSSGPRRGFGAVAGSQAATSPTSPTSAPVRRGFGAATATAAPTHTPERIAPEPPPQAEELPLVDEVDGQACPIDPMERLQCDSCQ